MEQPGNARLNTHNMGAVLKLNRGDLLIAHVFPLSRGIHLVRLIVTEAGQAEYGEYLIPPREEQQFFHGHVEVIPGDLEALRNALDDLCSARNDIDFDDDSDEYEEPTRRLLRHWCHGTDTFSVSPSDGFYTDYEVHDGLREAYVDRFETAWRITNRLIEQGRTAARVED